MFAREAIGGTVELTRSETRNDDRKSSNISRGGRRVEAFAWGKNIFARHGVSESTCYFILRKWCVTHDDDRRQCKDWQAARHDDRQSYREYGMSLEPRWFENDKKKKMVSCGARDKGDATLKARLKINMNTKYFETIFLRNALINLKKINCANEIRNAPRNTYFILSNCFREK